MGIPPSCHGDGILARSKGAVHRGHQVIRIEIHKQRLLLRAEKRTSRDEAQLDCTAHLSFPVPTLDRALSLSGLLCSIVERPLLDDWALLPILSAKTPDKMMSQSDEYNLRQK